MNYKTYNKNSLLTTMLRIYVCVIKLKWIKRKGSRSLTQCESNEKDGKRGAETQKERAT